MKADVLFAPDEGHIPVHLLVGNVFVFGGAVCHIEKSLAVDYPWTWHLSRNRVHYITRYEQLLGRVISPDDELIKWWDYDQLPLEERRQIEEQIAWGRQRWSRSDETAAFAEVVTQARQLHNDGSVTDVNQLPF